MAWPIMGIRWKLEFQRCGFHIIFYDFDNDCVPIMNTIGDLVITLKSKTWEDIESRTKKIDKASKNLWYEKRPKVIQVQK